MNIIDDHAKDAGIYLKGLFDEIYEEQLAAECKTEKQKEVKRRMRKLKLRVVEGGRP